MGAVAALMLAALTLTAAAGAPTPQAPPIQGFSLADVELAPGSEFAANFNQTSEYLLMLEPDRLLYNFRTTAGLPAPGASYGGWESPGVEVRGQFIGHYLSAAAFAAVHTGRREFHDRSSVMVTGLRQVQDAHGNGYLSAFPESHFDRLEALQPVWAPYYVIHKLMAGLVDQHQLLGSDEALQVAKGMATYFCGRARRVQEQQGVEHWRAVLENEFGGMEEVLYNLYAATGNSDHAECARWFNKPAFYRPLLDGKDPLPGLHANTHLAQVQGFAARYEHLGDEEGMAAVRAFFATVLQASAHHTFSTGGSNWYERWGEEDRLGDAINNTDASGITEESCTQYNILKLARYLFRHTGDPGLADFYERAVLNDVIGVQKLRESPQAAQHPHLAAHLGLPQGGRQQPRATLEGTGASLARPANYQVVSWPDDPYAAARAADAAGQAAGPGVYIYYLPLGAGLSKDHRHGAAGWGTPFDTFWCCYGTAVESFAKLADSIYFKQVPGTAPSAAPGAQDLPQLFVNQLVSSSVRWRELGVEVAQAAELYGPSGAATSRLTIAVRPPSRADGGAKAQQRFVLNWRIPGWAKADELVLRVNGKQFTGCAEGAAAAWKAQGTQPPRFGAGARFCALGSTWTDGDEVEAEMPMRWLVEGLNDNRPELAPLKAIMHGPLLMAGLTHDTRELLADPERIEEATSLPDASGFVSLAVTAPGLPAALAPLLRHCNGSVAVGGGCRGARGAPLDATFRLVAPLAGCDGAGGAGCTRPDARRLLAAPASVPGDGALHLDAPQLVSFEAASQPGQFLTVEAGSGLLMLEQQAPSAASGAARVAAQTFLLRPQARQGASTFSLEPLSQPGGSMHLSSSTQQLRVQPFGAGDAAAFSLVAPAASSYPPGARLLHGRNRNYLLVPLGQIMDEHYTAYFSFVEDASSAAAA